ncbi:disease resistance protein RGA2-like [Phragmites australis]|uniref:disease resistance protein RGA2-like n=1 Tax=Phragmites australis TaxID=29695 RepID=UPI002D77A08F|nr:disease resistance protein RGA2-like [Phragmites australis]
MDEAVVSAVITDAVTRVISFIAEQLKNRRSVSDKLQKVRHLLVRIQSVVEEAQGRQITNHALLEWLSELINSMHQGRFLLDTFQSGTVEFISEPDDTTVPQSFSLSSFNPAKRLRVAAGSVKRLLFHGSRENELNSVLENLKSMSSDLSDFIMLVKSYPSVPRPLTTNIYVDSSMFGRHIEREQIFNFLMQDNCPMETFGVLPIIGDKGVGKTTLVQHVCDDVRVRNHFPVIVFYDFIYTYLMANSDSRIVQHSKFIVGDMRNFDEQLHVLKRTLSGNRFLLVFENVDLHNMQTLQILLQTLQCAKKGCKIIVTSDKNRIASLGTINPIRLKILPQAEYWFFFKAHAFAGADVAQNPRLVAMGREIAKGLQGSFFGSKIIGALLRAHPTPQFWSKFLRNDIGELSLFGDGLGYMYDVAETILPRHVRVWRVSASAWWPDYPGRTLASLQDLSLERQSSHLGRGHENNLHGGDKDCVLQILLCKSVFPLYSVYYTAHCAMI